MLETETRELTDPEFNAVSALPAGERYNHLVKRVADWQWIWLLEDDAGLAGQGDVDGRYYLPVWPHPRYAKACAADAWTGARPAAIEIHVWVEESLPGLEEEGGRVSAFPTPSHQGFIVPPWVKTDLEEELSLYE